MHSFNLVDTSIIATWQEFYKKACYSVIAAQSIISSDLYR